MTAGEETIDSNVLRLNSFFVLTFGATNKENNSCGVA